MRRLVWMMRRIKSVRWPKSERPALLGSLRDRLAVLLALLTVAGLGAAFFFSKGTAFLMPGPLTSAHGAIENCGTCHTKSGSGKLSWIHGLFAGDPLADSKACLTCHKMQDTAFNAHGASAEVLKRSTERLTKIATGSPAPQSARAQSIAFPTQDMVARGLYCATCHQEHQGTNFNLNKISNEECRSCHVLKFDSFDSDHPKFDSYPFKRRTQIVYDHAAHFNKHYPEVAKKDLARRIPATCSTCHNSQDDKRIMAVAPFEKSCSACHLDQITGKERVSGPKGIAFFSLPGLDLQTLKKKNAAIGEWPEASDAALTPFMKVMISRNEQGRALVTAVGDLNLQDLTNANDGQINAVRDLAWEIKRLFHALISGKASDVLADLNIGGAARLSPVLIADLTAGLPRDVFISAQQQWLPNLAKEIANGQIVFDRQTNIREQEPSNPNPATTKSKSADSDTSKEPPISEESRANNSPNTQARGSEGAKKSKLDPPACVVRVLGQCLVSKGTGSAFGTAQPEEAVEKTGAANTLLDDSKKTPSAGALPGPMRAGLMGVAKEAENDAAAGNADAAKAKSEGGIGTPAAGNQSQGEAMDQSDYLLYPTEEEQREINARNKDAGKAAQSDTGPARAAAALEIAPANAGTKAAHIMSIESGVDPESWAEHGGWYQQDYAIFYRPTGHKDKFIYSWLTLTGLQAPKGNTSPPTAVFDFLTSKDAQGACTKCHSVDDIPGKGRVVNFSQPSAETKQGSFTHFIHEPHFGIIGNRGCLTCHNLENDKSGDVAEKTDAANVLPEDAASVDIASKANAATQAETLADSSAVAASADTENARSEYLKSYEQSNPHKFTSEFSSVTKDLCQTCHTGSLVRQDCLLCHKYHVNGIVSPITNTKLPAQ